MQWNKKSGKFVHLNPCLTKNQKPKNLKENNGKGEGMVTNQLCRIVVGISSQIGRDGLWDMGDAAVCVPLVPGNTSGNAYGNRRVPLILFPSHSSSVPPGRDRSTPFVSKSRFISLPKQQTRFFLPRIPLVRGMSDNLVDKTVGLRMNKNFMKFMNLIYPWILKQRFPTSGTVISGTDHEQDDVEMDYE